MADSIHNANLISNACACLHNFLQHRTADESTTRILSDLAEDSAPSRQRVPDSNFKAQKGGDELTDWRERLAMEAWTEYEAHKTGLTADSEQDSESLLHVYNLRCNQPCRLFYE